MTEVAEEGEADGVGRRAVDGVAERAVGERPLAHAQRPHQRLLVADRALVRVRGDDGHVAHRIEGLLEGQQPARLDAVVVGHEDAWPGGPLGDRSGGRLERPRPAAAQPAGEWLAPLLVDVAALRTGPLAGHVREVAPRPARSGSSPARAGGSCPSPVTTSRRRSPLRASGSRGTRTGRPSRSLRRLAARSATVRSAGVERCRKWKKNADSDGRDRDAEDRAGDARDARADEHRAEDDDGVDADGALHDPGLQDVHDHEPADDHDGQ